MCATAGPSGGWSVATGRYRSLRRVTDPRRRGRAHRRRARAARPPAPRGIFHAPPAPRPRRTSSLPGFRTLVASAILFGARTGAERAQASLALVRPLALPLDRKSVV